MTPAQELDLRRITFAGRHEIDRQVFRARRGFFGRLSDLLGALVLIATLSTVATGIAFLAVFVFANLVFHINPGL